jgi:transposase InsO family protein
MRGRNPSGPEYVIGLDGSDKAKERLQVVLETVGGKCRVREACRRLGIREDRFGQLRFIALSAALVALEPRSPGRPPRSPTPADDELRQARARIAQLEAEVQAAVLRAELAVTLPQVGATAKKNDADPVTQPQAIVEEVTVSHLQARCAAPLVEEGPPRRGFASQRKEREQEQATRRHAVAVGERLVEQGVLWDEVAKLFKLAPRTLRDWRQGFEEDVLCPHPLGRPVVLFAREERNSVIHFLDEYGPGIGLATLRDCFSAWPRAGLGHLLNRYRRVWRERHRQPLRVLHWTYPGSVWAMDFTGPLPAIDGTYPYVLAIRDLASGLQLLTQPLRSANADAAIAALAGLFMVLGAPLVLKRDNGSAFGTAELMQLLREFGVESLFSPPRVPSYNGAIEAGIGSWKVRAEHQAARHGRPGQWSCDDVEAARLEANATARLRGRSGPSPDECWSARTPLTYQHRQRFQDTVARLRQEHASVHGGPFDTPQDEMSQRATDREVIRQALEDHRYLHYTRRRILRPIPRKKVAGIP